MEYFTLDGVLFKSIYALLIGFESGIIGGVTFLLILQIKGK